MRATAGLDAEVFIVDNDSHDGSVEYLRSHFPDVNYIECNHNLGFARANNIAIRQSAGEYVLLLNPDTIVGEETLRNVLLFMDAHPDSGGVGVKMLKCNGERAMESRRGLPAPMTAFYKMCGLCNRFPKSRRFGRYYMSYLPWDEPVEIEVISGAFCMLRRTALNDAGLLDEDFFMYGEDIDLSYRLLKKGYKNWYLPETILHYKGESTQKSSYRYVHVFYDAMLIFFKKHYGNSSIWFTLPIKAAIYAKAFIALVRMQTANIRKALGFSPHKRPQGYEYVFIGSPEMLDQCRTLTGRKGLSGEFFAGDSKTCPDGHLSMLGKLEGDTRKYVVYDTGAFDFQTILRLFERHPVKNVYLATYNPSIGTLITDEEIIR